MNTFKIFVAHMKNIKYLIILATLGFLPSCIFYRNPEVPIKGIKHMTLEESVKARDYYRKVNDTELLIKALERVIALSTDYKLTDEALLELADLQLEDKRFEAAQKLYRNYNTLYPGSSRREDAWYHEILAHQRDISSPDRDQSKTRETLALTKKFLEEFDEGKHNAEVERIQRECYKHLLKHELIVMHYYLKRYSYEELPAFLEAVRTRLVYSAQELLKPLETEIPDFGPLRNQILLLPQQAAGLIDQIINLINKVEQKLYAPRQGKMSMYKRLRDRF